MFTAADLQKAKLSKVDIIETDKNGKKTIVSKTGERISTLEGTSAGFVVDTKPDPQLARVMDNLFVGSQDSTQNLLGCEENKITHVLNLVEGISPAFPDKFTYRTIPILDVEESGLDEVLGDCFEFIDNAINNGGSCLVHCNAGVSRSCSVVLAYRMKKEPTLTYEQALKELREIRPAARPNDGFHKQLQKMSEGR